MKLPLFPLHSVLFPGGVLPLRIFEQRYVTMVKSRLAEANSFGICLITAGDEVMRNTDVGQSAPEIARIGTFASVLEWDMPQLGILHVVVQAQQRFAVERQSVAADGLMTGEVSAIPAEPQRTIAEAFTPLVRLLEVLAPRVGAQQFPAEHRWNDASWVGYRLAELLPLPSSAKQSMLEINDSEVRLTVIKQFLEDRGVL